MSFDEDYGKYMEELAEERLEQNQQELYEAQYDPHASDEYVVMLESEEAAIRAELDRIAELQERHYWKNDYYGTYF